jgi:hypothetical protein
LKTRTRGQCFFVVEDFGCQLIMPDAGFHSRSSQWLFVIVWSCPATMMFAIASACCCLASCRLPKVHTGVSASRASVALQSCTPISQPFPEEPIKTLASLPSGLA